MSPLTYSDYKVYLSDFIKENGSRGIKANLAEAAGCQRSFFSQVIGSSVHLTLDHALGVAQFIGLNSNETEYFYSLVGYARAATPALRRFYKQRMNTLKKEGENLSKRLTTTPVSQSIAEYYSTWKYAAIHISCTIPGLRTAASIAAKLKLTEAETSFYLDRLANLGILQLIKGQWHPTSYEIHLPKDHFMTYVNHQNWRERNLRESAQNPDSLSYSAIYSMSTEDFEKLKEMTISFLQRGRELVISSKEQELVGFGLDCVKYS